MFENPEQSKPDQPSGQQVPASPIPEPHVPPVPPSPPQLSVKSSEPVVEPPPPTGESPHMDLPTPGPVPSPTSKIKIIIASLAGVILLGGIGYGGWYVYQNMLKGDISNITNIFGSEEGQEQMVEVEVNEETEPETPAMEEEFTEEEVLVDNNRYEFNESYEVENRERDTVTIKGSIDMSEDNKTYNISAHLTVALGSNRSPENFNDTFNLLRADGLGWFILVMGSLNPDYSYIITTDTLGIAGEQVDHGNILSNFSLLGGNEVLLPTFTNSIETVKKSGATLAGLEISMEVNEGESIYPIMRYKYDDASNNIILANYSSIGVSKTTTISFNEFLKIEDGRELFPDETETVIDTDAELIASIQHIQFGLELRYVNNENYPVNKEAIILGSNLQLCDEGFVENSVECSGEIYREQVLFDNIGGEITYRSPVGTWYEIIFKLSDTYSGNIGLQPGFNIATPSSMMPYGNPDEDNDGDGLINSLEVENDTDVSKPDTDSDGLSDYDEVIWWATDPLNWDSDGDEFGDGEEIFNGYNPLGEGRLFE